MTKVDSVTLNNNEVRKRLQLEMQDNPNWGKQYWIDGIGSNLGMLSHFYYCFVDYNEGFLCFYNDSELLYPQTPPSCFITSDQEIEQNKIEIYPNPVSDNLSIICQGGKLTRFILTDLIGRTVHKGKLKEDENWIQVGHLQNGYYNILLGDEKVFKHSKKILKIE